MEQFKLMKKINITISGGLGRMGSLLIQKVKEDRSLNLSSVTEQRELKKNGISLKKTPLNLLKKPMSSLILQDQTALLKF